MIMSLWSFSKWRINLLGHFPLALGKVKYMIMPINYFMKWVKVEPLSTIITIQARKFVWRNIFPFFEILKFVVTDNGTQFIDQKFRGFLASYQVKHHLTSMEHPQANGQVEASNKVTLRGLKKRLDEAKEAWAAEVKSVLWPYWTTPLNHQQNPLQVNLQGKCHDLGRSRKAQFEGYFPGFEFRDPS